MQENKEQRVSLSVVFAVLICSALGAQLFGVSLNKIALIPLELIVLYKLAHKGFHIRFGREQMELMYWFLVIIVSSLIGLMYSDQLSGTEEKLLLNIVQTVLIYIPILLGMNTIKDPIKQIKKGLVITAKINCIWGLIQFVSWYIARFDFNQFVFSTLFRGLLGTNWTAWNYELGSLAIRVTGLNHDSAFFAMCMIIGFCLCDKWIWKALCFSCCALSLSRAGILTLFILAVIIVIQTLRKRGVFNKNRSIKILIGIVLIIVVFIVVYNRVSVVNYQINYLNQRIMMIFDSGSEVGTSRHLLYIPMAFLTWLVDLPIINKIFGVGLRAGGAALVSSTVAGNVIPFTPGMKVYAWAVECDMAEVLLGTGIVGFALYYFMMIKKIKKFKNNEENGLALLFVGFLVFGIMYNISTSTLLTLILLFTCCDLKKELAQ